MSRVNFTPDEEKELLEILERYLPQLEIEIADTDSKPFLHELQKRAAIMKDMIKRLRAVVN
jgi:hypothetical protein